MLIRLRGKEAKTVPILFLPTMQDFEPQNMVQM
jgi:hypothetical protein